MSLQVRQPIDKNSRTVFHCSVLKTRVYDDGTYFYVCKAIPGAALTDAVWQVKRIDSDGSSLFADSDELFNNLATNVTIVSGLSY